MDPQTPINQVPDEKLATLGWNLREQQDAHRRQADLIEQQLASVRGEFQRRYQERQDAVNSQEANKTTAEDALASKIVAMLDKTWVTTPETKDAKDAPK